MGFATYSTPYDWSRVAKFRAAAAQYPGGAVDLSIGSPVDPVSEGVRKALADASNARNAYGYPATVGTPELREAISQWYRRDRGVDLAAIGASVVPSVGSKEAVALMASLLQLGPGDVIVQPRIAYPTYAIGTQLAGATIKLVDAVEDTASWERIKGVKAIWVNSPNNPSGKVLNAFQLHDIVMAARRIGAVVLSDECYALLGWQAEKAAYAAGGAPVNPLAAAQSAPVAPTALATRDAESQGAPGTSGAASAGLASVAAPSILDPGVCAGSAEGILALYSLSKQSNLAGYRVAFIAGDKALIDPMAALRKQIGLIIPGPVQAAMTFALGDDETVLAQRRKYASRLASLVDGLRAFGYEDAMIPDGGLYVWVKALGADCWDDMDALATLGIVPAPGEFYGDAGYLRFSVTASDEAVNRAAHRLRGA